MYKLTVSTLLFTYCLFKTIAQTPHNDEIKKGATSFIQSLNLKDACPHASLIFFVIPMREDLLRGASQIYWTSAKSGRINFLNPTFHYLFT